MDEFVNRFNGTEVPDFIKKSSAPQTRKTYVSALFDTVFYPNANREKNTTVDEFVSAVVFNNHQIDMYDSNCYAEARCIFVYKGKDVGLNVVLQYEKIREDYYKWSIVGANGLDEAGLLPPQEEGYISPVQHEFHFAELKKAFPHMSAYCKHDYRPDQLSYLQALVEKNVLQYKYCEYHRYYFFSVPNYLFIVTLKNRIDTNSGWLISDVVEVTPADRQSVIGSFLGRNH
ncbi:MAG: hypothetical protein IJK84_03470 [Bacteroidales bacterium]|nr:hypothetical protein [Bacteroidales bacterium]